MSMLGLALATERPKASGMDSALADSTRHILLPVFASATAPTPATAAAKARQWLRARPMKRGCEPVLSWSAPAQHAGGIAAVIDDDGGGVRILCRAAKTCRGAAGCGKRPCRIV